MRKIIAIFGILMTMFGLSANVYNKGKKVKTAQLNEWFATNREHKAKMHCTIRNDSKLGNVFIIYDDIGNKYVISNENTDGIDSTIMNYYNKVMNKDKE